MRKKVQSYMVYVGVLSLLIGLGLNVFLPELNGAMKGLPFVLIGFGAGIVGVAAAGLLQKRNFEKHPEKAKQHAIEEKDERNVRLREKAGYAAWYVSLCLLAILSLVFFFLDDYRASMMLLGVLFINIISLLVFISIYNKKM